MIVKNFDYCDPERVYAEVAERFSSHFLNSCTLARYSYIALDVFSEISAQQSVVYIDGVEQPLACPFKVLSDTLNCYLKAHNPELPPFQGGAVGYFAYELAHNIEYLPEAAERISDAPEMIVHLCATVLAFDHKKRSLWLIHHPDIHPAQQDAGYRYLERQLPSIISQKSDQCALPEVPPSPDVVPWHSNFSRSEYERSVQKIIDYIYAGDIFQANLAQVFRAEYSPEKMPSMLALYQRLAKLSPAPFSACLNFGDTKILSSSPERFLKVEGSTVYTSPIKGTRPRGIDTFSDQQNAQNLLSSQKDRAENIMIVDLLRNDLSRVCEPHSVEVPQLCGLESYANVHHLVSTITARLSPQSSLVDALKSCFPGGSITGAPKIRAMEIITELEQVTRGPYCGALGYIGFNQSMDLNIAIRTLSIYKEQIAFHAGGGIVADSVPAAEYQETLVKASKFFEVMGIYKEHVTA